MSSEQKPEVIGQMVVPTRRPPSETEGRGVQPPSEIHLKAQEAKTARTLAFVLVVTLVSTFVLQQCLIVLMTFYNKPDAITHLEHSYGQWLPVLSGLVGTAVGFYLKERKS